MKTVIEDVTNLDPSENDETLFRILNQSNGDVEQFLRVVCGFLKRKTSFVSSEGSEKKLLKIFRDYQAKGKGVKSGFLGKASRASVGDPEVASLSAVSKSSASKPVSETTPPLAAEAAVKQDDVLQPEVEVPAPVEETEEDDKDKGLPPNAGNGLDLEKYCWTQTLGDLTIAIPVPSGTRGRDCMVDLKAKHLIAGVKGAPALDGALHAEIVVDDCYWNCDGKSLEVTLQKKDAMNWWACVLEGEPRVNTQKVQPENSKLSDLDGETRQTVEKMMFDQRQKALNRPTSDQMKQQDMLKKFMEAHPEMDFSNAKIM